MDITIHNLVSESGKRRIPTFKQLARYMLPFYMKKFWTKNLVQFFIVFTRARIFAWARIFVWAIILARATFFCLGRAGTRFCWAGSRIFLAQLLPIPELGTKSLGPKPWVVDNFRLYEMSRLNLATQNFKTCNFS